MLREKSTRPKFPRVALTRGSGSSRQQAEEETVSCDLDTNTRVQGRPSQGSHCHLRRFRRPRSRESLAPHGNALRRTGTSRPPPQSGWASPGANGRAGRRGSEAEGAGFPSQPLGVWRRRCGRGRRPRQPERAGRGQLRRVGRRGELWAAAASPAAALPPPRCRGSTNCPSRRRWRTARR